MLKVPPVEELRFSAREAAKRSPLAHLLPVVFLGNEGKILGRSGSSFGADADEADAAQRAELFFHATMNENIVVRWTLMPVTDQIILEHECRLDDFLTIVSDNPLVPQGRENLWAKGLLAGLRWELDIAAHLLIPQFEHSLRNVLYQEGVITSSIDNEGIQKEYDLNRMLPLQIVRQIFGEDLTFHLRRMLVEPLGGNLRNLMAHGLLSSGQFFTAPVASFGGFSSE